jgi:hypothetical protein
LAPASSPDAPAPRRSALLLGAKLLLAVALIAGELQVLAWIARPRVDDAYRRHFITRSSGCWSPPAYIQAMSRGPQPRLLVPGQFDKAITCVYLPDGWSLPEEIGIWSIGRHAVIMAPFRQPARRISLWFVAPGYLPEPQRLVIRQGALRLAAADVALDKETMVEIRPDAAAADANGFVRLDLDIAHPMSPRASSWRRFDKRLLGVRLTRMEILER